VTVTLVVPCYNEASRWDAERFRQLAAIPDVQLLFVDDGSQDATREKIQELVHSAEQEALFMQTNAGKAEAVRTGLLSALQAGTSTAVGFIDADGAFGVEDVERMVALTGPRFSDGFDALWSSRVALSGRSIERRTSRHYIGRLVATALSTAYPDLPYDSQSGFKVFAVSEELQQSLDQPFDTRWIFEVELLLRWQRIVGAGMRIW
jgi:glycosyltransferase involved in cell wall biosynthesis